MTPFYQATVLNNKAVTSLLTGDIATATKLLEAAIKFVRADHLTHGKDDSGRRKSSPKLSFERMRNTYTVEIPAMGCSDAFIVFKQAIRIPDFQACEEDPTEVERSIFASAIVFNYALTAHVKASSQDESIDKAELLYNMVLQLLNGNAECTHESHMALVVTLAAINNLTQIRQIKLGPCQRGGDEMIQYASQLARQLRNPALLQDPKIHGLIVNLLILSEPPVASAA